MGIDNKINTSSEIVDIRKNEEIGKIGGKMSAILDYGPQFIEK